MVSSACGLCHTAELTADATPPELSFSLASSNAQNADCFVIFCPCVTKMTNRVLLLTHKVQKAQARNSSGLSYLEALIEALNYAQHN
jgi:hypothetical protein